MIFDATKTVPVWSPKMFRFSTWGGGGVLGDRMRNRHRYVICMYMYAFIYLLFIIYYFRNPLSKVFIIVKLDLKGFMAFL